MISLREWLETGRKTQAELAQEAGCTAPYISLIASGGRVPSLRLARRISKATGGEVPLESFAGDE